MASTVRFLIALWCLSCAIPASAQQPAAPAPPASAQQPPPGGAPPGQKPNYGQWWLQNARDLNPRPAEWLFHAEGGGSFANQTGSVSGYQHQANVLAALRKNLVTNQAGITLTIQEARVEHEGNFKQTTARFFDLVYYNVASNWNVVTALILEKDEPKRVHRRVSVFEGVSRDVTLPHGRHLSFAAAGGYEAEHVEGQFGPEDENSPTIYGRNMFMSPIGQRGVFTHQIEFFYDLSNHNDFRTNWNAGLNLQVTPHIGIGPSVQIRYDSHPVSQIQTTDTMVVFGFQFK